MKCYNCKQDIGSAVTCPYCGAVVLKEPRPHHLPVGTVIDGKYAIKGVLGEGGFGITYLAYNNRLKLDIAVKEYFPRGFVYRSISDGNSIYVSANDAKEVFEHGKERFLSEAQTLAKFQSEPGVVSVTDFVEENNTAYLIMEYIEGVTLIQHLKQHGVMDAEDTFMMFEPMMRTLEKIHAAGVIHRDISPDNIMRLNDGQLKLMDFGSAREYVDESQTMSVLLKKGYAPMEQYHRNGSQGPWTDVYALCATIYHCITGKRPEDAFERLVRDELQPPSALGFEIPPVYESLLMYGLALHKEDRCQSMMELLNILQNAKKAIRFTQTVDVDKRERDQLLQESNRSQEKSNVALESNAIDDRFDATQNANEKLADQDIDYNEMPSVNQEGRNAYSHNQGSKPSSSNSQEDSYLPNSSTNSRSKKNSKRSNKTITAVLLLIAIAVGIIGGITQIKPTDKKAAKEKNNTVAMTHESSSEMDSSSTDAAKALDNRNNKDWTNIVSISACEENTVGVKNDGTVVHTDNINRFEHEVDEWKSITAICTGYNRIVGLKDDGTVVAVGSNINGECDVEEWTGITAIATGVLCTVGLKNDGTVLSTGTNEFDENEGWTDITAISAGNSHFVGLKKDGTVVSTKIKESGPSILDKGQTDVEEWKDITAISAGYTHTVGLKKDGTVVAVGSNIHGECDVEEWKDIIAIAVGINYTVGLKKDGRVVIAGELFSHEDEISNWSGIIAIASGSLHVVGLKKDGTVVAVGENEKGQCEVENKR